MGSEMCIRDRIKDGGDINVILDPNLDGFGSKPKLKESVRQIGNICLLQQKIQQNDKKNLRQQSSNVRASMFWATIG